MKLKRFVVLTLLLLSACDWLRKGYPTAPAETEQEQWVLSETTRFAKQLTLKVHGEITTFALVVRSGTGGCPAGGVDCVAAGFYGSGTCYYYKPYINKYSFEILTNLAAHEVCHAKHYMHGSEHDACIRTLVPDGSANQPHEFVW